MIATLFLTGLMAQQPAAAPAIEIGRAPWANLERIEPTVGLPTPSLVGKVQQILRQNQCHLPGQRASRFDFTVNYAVRFDDHNQVERVLVQDMGCELIEVLVGNMVTQMLQNDLFRLPAMRRDRWMSNSVNFNLVS